MRILNLCQSTSQKSFVIVSFYNRNSKVQNKNQPITQTQKVRTARFLGDLREEDFTSKEFFLVAQKHLKNCNHKKKIANQKINRLKKENFRLKNLLSELNKKSSLSSNDVSDLEVHTKT